MKRLIVLVLLIIPFAHAQDALPAMEIIDCPFLVPDTESVGQTLECGVLYVPENRSRADSPAIELVFVMLDALNPTDNAPIIYLEGGPGGSAVAAVDAWYGSALRNDYDLVLVDQRGTGYSLPSLNCPEVDEDSYPDGTAAAQACHDRLVSEGIDLGAYNTVENAADINDLRLVLGYEQVNLFGVSYGTRLALEIMQNHPEGVRSVILDGVYPPNVSGYSEQPPNAQRAFEELFARCEANPACRSAYPDLEAVFYTTVDQLNDFPALYESEDGEQEILGDDLVNELFQQMYSTAMIPFLPAMITAASEGDFDRMYSIINGEYMAGSAMSEEEFDALLMDYLELASLDELYDYVDGLSDEEYADLLEGFDYDFGMMQALGYTSFTDFFDYLNGLTDEEYDALLIAYEGIDDDSEGLYNSVDCNDEVYFQTLDEVYAAAENVAPQLAGAMVAGVEEQFSVCDVWKVPQADASENEAVVSDIPTLVLNGSFDPITPPDWGEVAAQTLSRSYLYTFPGVGHGSVDVVDCATQIALQFLSNPAAEPDASCIQAMTVTFEVIDP